MKLALALFVGAALCAALWWHLAGGQAQAGAPSPRGESRAGSVQAEQGVADVAAAAKAATQAQAARASRPAERNTIFRTDANGGLIVDDAVAQRIEALAASLPERHSLAELERVEGVVREGLAPQQAQEALRLLRNYLAYSRAETRLLTQARETEDVAGALAMHHRVVTLRREHFGPPTAYALFGAQEAQTLAGLEALSKAGE